MTPSRPASEKSLLQQLRKTDLNPVDEANAFFGLNELAPGRWSSETLGDLVRQPAAYVEASFRLLELADSLLDDLREGHLTRDQALELLRLPSDKLRDKVAREIVHSSLTLLQTRQLVNGMRQLTRAGEDVPVRVRRRRSSSRRAFDAP